MNKVKSILLIDDSKAINSRNENLLKSMGFFEEIHQYTRASEAIEFLKMNANALPEIILLDISMPEVDGFDFLDEYINLKELTKAHYSPVIAILSANLDFDNFTKSKNYKSYGVLDHIKKPLDKEDIINLLEEHFEAYAV